MIPLASPVSLLVIRASLVLREHPSFEMRPPWSCWHKETVKQAAAHCEFVASGYTRAETLLAVSQTASSSCGAVILPIPFSQELTSSGFHNPCNCVYSLCCWELKLPNLYLLPCRCLGCFFFQLHTRDLYWIRKICIEFSLIP